MKTRGGWEDERGKKRKVEVNMKPKGEGGKVMHKERMQE